MTVAFDPAPRWPLELRNTPGLHGAITALRDMPHARFPAWSLRPWMRGWAVYFADIKEARHWAARTWNGALWDRPTSFTFGPLVRLRNPVVPKRGRSRVRLDTITPVVMRSYGGKNSCTRPSTEALLGTLGGEFVTRLSPSQNYDAWAQWVRPRVRLSVLEVHTEPTHTALGSKLGVVDGWHGHVLLEVNAVAYWLLLAAERATGLAGRTAFGFGRIRVTPVSA